MQLLLLLSLFAVTATTASAQLKQPTLEELAAKRWTELNADRIAAEADGQGITLSDIRRQIDPIIPQIRSSTKSDADFDAAVKSAAEETLRSLAERQLVISEFRTSTATLPGSYIDADIEDTIRRDFGGDRNRFVASLRAAGTTPLAYRKYIEDRIIFDFMVGQIRRAAWDVNPGKIQEYYDKNKADFVRKDQIKLRQITITQGAAERPAQTAARAADWADALRHPAKLPAMLARYKVAGEPFAGTPTFADVAARVSTDDFAIRGGDAGWRNLEDLNEAVNAKLKGLRIGEVSDPIRFDVGASPLYVIVSREDERAKGHASVNDPEVMAEIEAKVRQISMKIAIQDWLNGLREKHFVQFR